jgi:hypothetical protein
VQAPAITLALGQNYDNGNFVQFDFAGATLADVDTTASVNCTTAGGVSTIVTLAYHSHNTTSATFRATGRVEDTTNAVCVFPASTFDVTTSALATPGSTVTVRSKGYIGGSNAEFDLSPTTATAVLVSGSQFTAGMTTPLDAVIDVEQGRGAFVTVGDDQMLITFSNSAGMVGFDGASTSNAQVQAYSAVISGDFSFIDDETGGAGCSAGDIGGGVGTITLTGSSAGGAAGAGTLSINTACNALTVSLAPGAGSIGAATSYGALLVFDKTTTTGPSFVAGSFSATTSVRYAGPTNLSATGSYAAPSAGSWSYNGFVAVVPFMPIQDNFSNTVYLTNRGSQSGGNISVTAYVAGNTPCTFTLTGVAPAANGAVNIGGRIKTQIRSCTTAGTWTGNLRATLVVTSPLPAATTELVTQYTDTTGGRTVSVPNSSTDYR